MVAVVGEPHLPKLDTLGPFWSYRGQGLDKRVDPSDSQGSGTPNKWWARATNLDTNLSRQLKGQELGSGRLVCFGLALGWSRA